MIDEQTGGPERVTKECFCTNRSIEESLLSAIAEGLGLPVHLRFPELWHLLTWRSEMLVNRSVSPWVPRKTGAMLSLLAVVVVQALLLAQDGTQAPLPSKSAANDPELLKEIIAHSRANLGKIQDWRGRARIRWERVHKEGPEGNPREEAATGVVTFVYDLNRANIQSNYVLEEVTNIPKGPPGYRQNQISAEYGRFSPVCWQFPHKENIIGSAFKHWYSLLKKETELPEGKITRAGSIVRFWLGPSEDNCDIYEIDLDKGACLVNHETVREGKVTSTWKLEPQLVDDIWIPRNTTRIITETDSTIEETIDWFENEIK